MQRMSAKKSTDKTDNIITVRMLGEFSVSYRGEKLKLERNGDTKAMHLLQYLLYQGKTGATSEYLMDMLYTEQGSVSNPHNNLKVNIFRLRRLLNNSGLPKGEHITYKNGKYIWESNIEVQIDAQLFDTAARGFGDGRRSASKRPAQVAHAISLYKGDFLPDLQSEPWAVQERIRLRELFISLSEEAIDELNSKNRFEDSYNIATNVISILPYEEKMHMHRISALLDQHRFSEALSAYDFAEKTFFEELGVAPSDGMREIYHRITGSVRNSVATIEEVRDNIRKDGAKGGAYYCNYPGFIDSFLFVSRLSERSGASLFFMLSTITDSQGMPFDSKSRLPIAADCMQNALFDALRASDLYTRYSPCQFLTLLTGIDRESCAPVANRINERFRELLSASGIRGIRASHSVCSAIVPDDEASELTFTTNLWEE